MKNIAEGQKLTLVATTDVTQGKGFMHGKLFVVPSVSVKAGKSFTAEIKGAYVLDSADIKDGITPTYDGSAAYVIAAENVVTTTASGNTKVGYFVNHLGEDVLLLTGA